MTDTSFLEGKRVLVVDDELDVIDTVRDLLPMCDMVTASSFEAAKQQLESQSFDVAILDIMGVSGYELLDICAAKDITAVMLTAHAVSREHIKKSYIKGAAYYIPKEEMSGLESFLTEVLQAKEKGQNTWAGWYKRFFNFCERRFGKDWVEKDKDFLDKITYY
ncbi:MAG: response regulator [Deltaproteobacteria bacterium]|jgi:CheY-like chemotaxis protein